MVCRTPPPLDNTKHESANISCAILARHTLGWVIEDAMDDTVDSTVRVNSLIVPALHELRNNPLGDLGGYLACRLVEDLLLLVWTSVI